MSRDQTLDDNTLHDVSQLRQRILRGAKGPDAVLGVGTEHEKIGFANAQGAPISYFGERGIEALFERLADRFGWTRAYDGGYLLALERDGGAITLEPGGQLELSGAVFQNVHGTARELENHLQEVYEVGTKELGLTYMFAGLNPWHKPDDIDWLPKPRYTVMKQYLPRVGPLSPWMMKTTASIQANFDFRDERDAMEMLRIAALASPLVTAIFANSPIKEGKRTGLASYRMAIWEETDKARCGTPAFMLDPESTVDDYVDWMLDVPMFFIKRGEDYHDMAGYSFRKFMQEGYQGHRATVGDWELHMTTSFPDVRLKQFVETRTSDCAKPEHIAALAALWKGIFYSREARARLLDLPLARNYEESEALIHIARTDGLDGVFRGNSLRELASTFIDISSDGLAAQITEEGDERVFLECLRDEQGVVRAPGETFLKDWDRHNGDPEALIRLWGIESTRS